MPNRPDLASLHVMVLRVAAAMKQPAPSREETDAFFERFLFRSQREGGRDHWACWTERLITDLELRNVTLAHLATWLSHENRVAEPGSETWVTPELEAAVDQILFGRPAALDPST